MTNKDNTELRGHLGKAFNDFEVKPPNHVLDKIKNTVAANKAAKTNTVLKRSIYWLAAALIVSGISYYIVTDDNSNKQSANTETSNQNITYKRTENTAITSDSDNKLNKKLPEKQVKKKSKVITFKANAGKDRIICGLECSMGAVPISSKSTGKWSIIDNTGISSEEVFTSLNEATSLVSVPKAGKYHFRWTETYKDKSTSDDVFIEFVDFEDINAGQDKSVCGLSCELKANGNNGNWTSFNDIRIENAGNTYAKAVSTKYGTYSFVWTEQKYSCKFSDTINISFIELPDANIDIIETAQCYGEPFTVECNYSNKNKYNWDFDNGSFNKLSTGIYTVLWNNSEKHKIKLDVSNKACTASSAVILQEPLKLSANFIISELGDDIPAMVYFTNMTMVGNDDYDTYSDIKFEWVFGDGETSNTDNPEHLYLNSGTYTPYLVVSDSKSCVDTAYGQTLKLAVNYEKTQSNFFTPNGDGINDVFKIDASKLQSFTCLILNKRGEKIFEWNNADGGWNGYLRSGNKAEAGVYYYIIRGLSFDNKAVEIPGVFYLIR